MKQKIVALTVLVMLNILGPFLLWFWPGVESIAWLVSTIMIVDAMCGIGWLTRL